MPPAHDESDVPPVDSVWSPEAMLVFMYNRCQRRFGQSADDSRRRLYAKRLQLLRDVMTAYRGGDPAMRLAAIQTTRTMVDLFEDEDSPL